MLSLILSACVLMAGTMWMHAAGIAVLLRNFLRLHALPPTGVSPIIRIAAAHDLVADFLHLAEISVWGLFYL